MDDQLKQIGERLAVQRGKRHLTQSELAEKVGLSVNHVSVIENGTKAMRIDTMIKICTILKMDYTYLVTGNSTISNIGEIQEMLASLKEHQFKAIMEVIRAFQTDNATVTEEE